jgi:hypothetical protein
MVTKSTGATTFRHPISRLLRETNNLKLICLSITWTHVQVLYAVQRSVGITHSCCPANFTFTKVGAATAMLMWTPVFWDVSQCTEARIIRSLGETSCFSLLRIECHRTANVFMLAVAA